MLIHNRLAWLVVTSVMVLTGLACGGKTPPGNGTTTQDGGIADADAGPIGGTGTLAIRMWRSDSPQGEVAIGDQRSALADRWSLCSGLRKCTLRPHEIPTPLRTGKMTPAELALPAGTHYVALYREGYVSSFHEVTVRAGERAEVIARLALDLTGRWKLVEVNGRPPMIPQEEDFVLDTALPTCNQPGHEAGDACLRYATSRWIGVLNGTRIFDRTQDASLEGQVLPSLTRIEYTIRQPGVQATEVWQKI